MRSKRKLIGKGRISSKASKASKKVKHKSIVPIGTIFLVNKNNGSIRTFKEAEYKYKNNDYGYKVKDVNSNGSTYLIQSVADHHTNSYGTPTPSSHIKYMLNKSKIK